jgi:hypothetical protein
VGLRRLTVEGGPGWGFTVTLVSDLLVAVLWSPISSPVVRVERRRDVAGVADDRLQVVAALVRDTA